jgi:hypothetical protein
LNIPQTRVTRDVAAAEGSVRRCDAEGRQDLFCDLKSTTATRSSAACGSVYIGISISISISARQQIPGCKDSLIANIPAGYSDGYRRAFSNKASVLIHGQGAQAGGKQGDEEITQIELETINGALLADLYTIWGNSNPKVLKSR